MQKLLLGFILFIFTLFSNIVYAAYSSSLCKDDPLYTCHTVKKGESWTSLFPDPDQRNLVMRINRTNLSLSKGMTIAIPKKLEGATMLDFAPMRLTIDPPGRKTIIVSLNKLAFGAYDANGELVYWGPVSGGKGYCPDIRRRCHSPIGQFAIYNKGGPGCVSTKFPVGKGGAPMPYCMFFHGGFALHGSYQVPGYNASHGCIRLFVGDAQWLSKEFTSNEKGVKVIVN